MENPEEILHCLEEFSKQKPRDIPRELEEYLCFVAKTGDPVYQWSAVKSLFKEKLVNVITDFNENSSSVEIPPCPNVEVFNYESMKSFILEKLDAFPSAPFTVQRICELLTTPRKEYNRIDKYMRALEKNILVVSTVEPGNRHTSENGEGIVNGLESDHILEPASNTNDINVEEMDDAPDWSLLSLNINTAQNGENNSSNMSMECQEESEVAINSETYESEKVTEQKEQDDEKPEEQQEKETEEETTERPHQSIDCETSIESVITSRSSDEDSYPSDDAVSSEATLDEDMTRDVEDTLITDTPVTVQKRRDSIEPVVSSEAEESSSDEFSSNGCDKEDIPSSAPQEIEPHIIDKEESSSEVEVSGSEEGSVNVNSSAIEDESETFEKCESSDKIEQADSAQLTCTVEFSPSSSHIQAPVSNADSDRSKSPETTVDSSDKCGMLESSSSLSCSSKDFDTCPESSGSATVTSSVGNESASQLPLDEEQEAASERLSEGEEEAPQRANDEQPINLAVEAADSSEDRDASRFPYGLIPQIAEYTQRAYRRIQGENEELVVAQAEEEMASSSTLQNMEIDIPDLCNGGGHTVEE